MPPTKGCQVLPHSKLTPGLYLLTCACENKCVYGFSMMARGESPSMLFNLVMTRFQENYNPHIIYDASCLGKEYGYNRELRRFMRLRITTDRFHQCNHTTCSDSFKSSQYQAEFNENFRSQEFSTRVSFIFSCWTMRNDFLKSRSRLET